MRCSGRRVRDVEQCGCSSWVLQQTSRQAMIRVRAETRRVSRLRAFTSCRSTDKTFKDHYNPTSNQATITIQYNRSKALVNAQCKRECQKSRETSNHRAFIVDAALIGITDTDAVIIVECIPGACEGVSSRFWPCVTVLRA